MSNFQTTEAKKEEYRKYLEKKGVLTQLTRALVGLYDEVEKPDNAIDFIKKLLGAPTDVDPSQLSQEIDALKKENSDLKKQIEEKEKELEALKNDAA